MTPGRTIKMEHSGVDGAGLNAGASTSNEERKITGETILSGQFMVSHFEIDVQEDEDEDVEDVKPDITDTVLSNIIAKQNPEFLESASNLIASSSDAPVPQNSQNTQKSQPLQLTSRNAQTSVEIETDLVKVFHALKVTYTQRLTSPKWNPFKGIRLRWKEKIRSNNVIWRCWHMQFIMRREYLVLQFASPLDVDIHNTPQSILLEGKYWKRQCNVIKAEYKKWRRYYVNKALGANNNTDNTSELDFHEWSPHSSEPLFMITDSMPTDTLFSTLSQYPFPDSREIARGAGRADFIQPSLGPLQPNLDDLMDLDLDFFRLAPVPEEGSDDILRAIDYNYLGGLNQLSSGSSIQEITDSSAGTSRAASGNHSVITGPGTSAGINQQQQSLVPSILTPSAIQYTAKLFTQAVSDSASASSSEQQQQLSNALSNYLGVQLGQQPAIVINNVPLGGSLGESSRSVAGSSDGNKDTKPRLSRSFPRHLGREPHNYDRCPPTQHQTMAFNAVAQPQPDPNMPNNPYPSTSYDPQPSGIDQMPGTSGNPNLVGYNMQQSQPISTQPIGSQPISTQPISSPVDAMNLSSSPIPGPSNANMFIQNMDSRLLTHSRSLPAQNQPANQKPQPRSISMPTAQNYPPVLTPQQLPPGSILQQHQQDAFKGSVHPQTSSYKSYHGYQPQPYTIPSQNPSAYGSSSRSMRHSSPTHGHQQQHSMHQQPTIEQSQQQLQDLQQQQQSSSQSSQQRRVPPHPTREMIRSQSLPLNATFPLPPKEDNFAVPRYQAKPSPRPRVRSNSMVMKQPGSSSPMPSTSGTNQPSTSLQATSSEPALNLVGGPLLAKLLASNTNTLFNLRQQPTSSSAISNLQTSQQQSRQPIAQSHQQQQPTAYQQQQAATYQQQQSPAYQQQQSPAYQQQQSSAYQQQQSPAYQQQQPPAYLQQQPSAYQQHQPPPMGSPMSPSSSQLFMNQPLQSPQQHARTNTQAQSSVLSFASPSTSYSNVSNPRQSMSPNLLFCSDTSMSAANTSDASDCSPSTSRGIGHKFHQQQQQRFESQRRVGHIYAEQRRRCNIKNGFDVLHTLVPREPHNQKLSKAAMLQEGARYIKELSKLKKATEARIESLHRDIEALSTNLTRIQLSLPANGVPVVRQRGRLTHLYRNHVRERMIDNWKYWVFGLLFQPLLNTFNQSVSVANLEELRRTSQLWVDQHGSLIELRPAITTQLRMLSRTTDLLATPPTTMQEEVMRAIARSLPRTPSDASAPTPAPGSGNQSDSNAGSPNPPSGGLQ